MKTTVTFDTKPEPPEPPSDEPGWFLDEEGDLCFIDPGKCLGFYPSAYGRTAMIVTWKGDGPPPRRLTVPVTIRVEP